MAFKKEQKVLIIFPPTQINNSRIFDGTVTKVEGSRTHPNIVVTPNGIGMERLNFSGVTGRGMGTPAFIVERERIEWALKQ